MKAATLTQFLVDITRGHRQNDFAVNPERLLNSSLLSERMRGVGAGINPRPFAGEVSDLRLGLVSNCVS